MRDPPKTPRRRRHAAMKDVGGTDDQRDRARSGRGAKATDRPRSPPRGPRHSPDRSRHRHSNPESTPRHHHHHHGRQDARDLPRQSSPDSASRAIKREDLIPRYREKKARLPDGEDTPAPRSRSRERAGPGSPSSIKRHRSRSGSTSYSHRKRSKRDHSSTGYTRDTVQESDSRKRGHHSPRDRRDHSSRRHRRQHRSRSPSHHEGTSSRSKRRSPSRSPTRSETGSNRDWRRPKSDVLSHPSRSRSPASASHNHSSNRTLSPPRGDQRDPSPATASGVAWDGADIDRRTSFRGNPPRSPKAHRNQRRRDESIEPHYSSRSDLDDDMTSRSSFRGGGYNPMYSKPHHSDSQGYSQSPQHGPSYHDSPNMSPYGQGRGGRNGHHHSPPHQYPPQYHSGSGSHTSHNNSSGPHHGSNSNSVPIGPMNPQGSYRGARGGPGFRGAAFGGRGNHRGSNFKSSPWTSGNQGHPPRGPHYPNDESNGRSQNFSTGRNEGDDLASEEMDADRRFANDTSTAEANSVEQEHNDVVAAPVAPPPPPPPSGPAQTSDSASQPASGAKFSFAFKASSKPTPVAPKPEISQKFNAVPPRQPPPQPQPSNRDSGPPRSAPTEPASARARNDFRNVPDGPKMAPRTRKVKKTMRRPKPRPCLPEDMIASESVFFRKPGNESVVGSGTYGKVFKGLNVYTKGLVALKKIRMEGERDGFPVTAIREIKLLQSLRHRNIVNLQEVMVEKNDCFMVFEYLSHDLTGLLNHPSFKLEPAQRKHLAKQLFEGLDYLHTRGVLHRDIKAANILVSNEGILKLADFGLARFYEKRHQLDYTNRVITIWYRSPELLLGETQYSAAIDVWSAACVMVEIFAKTPIFAGDGSEISQLDKIYNVLGTPSRQEWPGLVKMAWFELLRPTTKRPSTFEGRYKDKLTPAAFELLEHMFRYDPAKRPTAGEVLQHRYFTTETPLPKQAIELSSIDGDWHEFESKALRKENERRDREARRAAAKEAPREKDKKRAIEGQDRERESKRANTDDR